MGCVVAGIGFNIMHDGAHGSFSKIKWVNNMAAISLNLLGGSHFMWNMKHNVIHHAYTNIDGVDDDIDIKPWMRMSTTQPKYLNARDTVIPFYEKCGYCVQGEGFTEVGIAHHTMTKHL